MEVRSLGDRDDIRGILTVHAHAWQAAYDEILPRAAIDRAVDPDPDKDHIEDRYDTLWPDRDGVFIAERDETVVGYAYFRWGSDTKPFVGPDEAGLKEIYVHPAHWGSGIGTALLDRGIDRLPGRMTALKLEAFADNEIGSAFYDARGFERTGGGSIEILDDSYPTDIWTLGL